MSLVNKVSSKQLKVTFNTHFLLMMSGVFVFPVINILMAIEKYNSKKTSNNLVKRKKNNSTLPRKDWAKGTPFERQQCYFFSAIYRANKWISIDTL